MLLDGVGVDAVVNLGQLTVEVPAKREAAVFFALEPIIIEFSKYQDNTSGCKLAVALEMEDSVYMN